jgi:HNH endonuclease
MRHVSAGLRRLVVRRSTDCCEYCHLSQAGQEATFHIDHVIPVTFGGLTVADNLALACVSCSLRKGGKSTGIDLDTRQEAPIFNPRRDVWSEHFYWEGVRLIGLTAIGRATIQALDLNRLIILAIREEEAAVGRHP